MHVSPTEYVLNNRQADKQVPIQDHQCIPTVSLLQARHNDDEMRPTPVTIYHIQLCSYAIKSAFPHLSNGACHIHVWKKIVPKKTKRNIKTETKYTHSNET